MKEYSDPARKETVRNNLIFQDKYVHLSGKAEAQVQYLAYVAFRAA